MPTHIISPRFQRTVTVDANGKFVMYFCPSVSIWNNFWTHQYGSGLETTFSDGRYVYYADQGAGVSTHTSTTTAPINATSSLFRDEGDWAYNAHSFESGPFFKKMRILGAYL
jgi:hypothetical protein